MGRPFGWGPRGMAFLGLFGGAHHVDENGESVRMWGPRGWKVLEGDFNGVSCAGLLSISENY